MEGASSPKIRKRKGLHKETDNIYSDGLLQEPTRPVSSTQFPHVRHRCRHDQRRGSLDISLAPTWPNAARRDVFDARRRKPQAGIPRALPLSHGGRKRRGPPRRGSRGAAGVGRASRVRGGGLGEADCCARGRLAGGNDGGMDEAFSDEAGDVWISSIRDERKGVARFNVEGKRSMGCMRTGWQTGERKEGERSFNWLCLRGRQWIIYS